jgi:hypothetical protein
MTTMFGGCAAEEESQMTKKNSKKGKQFIRHHEPSAGQVTFAYLPI